MKRINVSRQGKWYLPGPESETLGRIEVEVVRFNAGCDDVTVALDALGDALARSGSGSPACPGGGVVTQLQRRINERLGKALFCTGFEDVMAALVDLRRGPRAHAGASLDRRREAAG